MANQLPQKAVDGLGLKEGDVIESHVVGERGFEAAQTPSVKEVLARFRKYRGRLAEGFSFDRLKANARL